MCRKSTLFIVIFIALQVVLAGNAFAAENGYTWWNGGGAADHRFTTGANWWQGVAPDINNTFPNEPNASFSEPIPIFCTVNPASGPVIIRDLIVGDWPFAANANNTAEPNMATLDVNNQTLNLTGRLVIGAKERNGLEAGIQAIGDVNVYNGGIINVGGNLWVGSEGTGYLNVRNGDVNITGTLRCPGGPAGFQQDYGPPDQRYVAGTGRINLYDGGTVEANDIYCKINDTAQINLRGGTLILKGDKTSQVAALISDGNIYAYNGDGDVLCDFDTRNPGKTTVTGTYDPNRAMNPSPANYAQEVELDANLSWTEANSAALNHVYFGTSLIDVNDGNASADKGSQVAATYDPCDPCSPIPGYLMPERTYYWRIDEVNTTTYKGNVWNFTVKNPYIPSHPNPSDNAANVTAEQVLRWTKGIAANQHKVYLGTNFSDVNTSLTPTSTTTEPNYNPGSEGLMLGPKTYYWRVDEVNTTKSEPNYWRGPVWTFATAGYRLIDNFDGAGAISKWTPCGGVIVISAAAVFDGTSPPTPTIDHNAMKVTYDNSGNPWYSEVNYTEYTDNNPPYWKGLSPAKRNWSIGGVKILGISFHGVQTNIAEKLYVRIRDANGNTAIEFPDSNAIVQRVDMVGTGGVNHWKYDELWWWWVIDLERFSDAGINLADVRNLIIGIGDKAAPGYAGKIYFDNIALYPRWCPIGFNISFDQSADADLNGDCSVDINDLEILVDGWLESSYQVNAVTDPNCLVDPNSLVLWYKFDEKSGYDVYDSSGNKPGQQDGSLNWALWDPCGHDGSGGVVFTGYGSTPQLISVPGIAAADVNLGGHSTVALWIKDNNQPIAQPTGTQLFQIGPSGQGNLQVFSEWTGYFQYVCGRRDNGWQDTLTWGRYGFTNPEHILGRWNHYAFTKDHTTGVMRIYHNGYAVAEYKEADGNSMPALVPGTGFFTIGAYRYPDGEGGYYTGTMDDFRLYKRALSDAEILRLYVGGQDPCSIMQPVLSSADAVKDNQVDFEDFARVAARWLENPLLWPDN